MNGRGFLVAAILIGVFLAGQYSAWRVQKYDYVYNYMYEFTAPQLRTILSAGHETILADMAIIRGIQFYGRNYPLLDKHPIKYEQFLSLGRTMEDLDPRNAEGYRFWGFALTSAQRGKVDSYRTLWRGAEALSATDEYFHTVMPDLWKVAKEAGYVAQYELQAATPEWGCQAYRKAQESPECPEFIHRLEYFACQEIEPDPLPPLLELAAKAESVKNPALRTLNIDHIRRIIETSHKEYWDIARRVYFEINGASATHIAQLQTVPVAREACNRYREASRKWFPDGLSTRLYPNLLNPNDTDRQPPQVVEAREPQPPIDPYGGEYKIFIVRGVPTLIGTGVVLDDRLASLEGYTERLTEYRAKHDDQCPPDFQTLATEMELPTGPVADRLGYPLEFDPVTCTFAYPELSEDVPPPLNPYGRSDEEMAAEEAAAKEEGLPHFSHESDAGPLN